MTTRPSTARRAALTATLAWLALGAVPACGETILFVGNSFTFAYGSPVWHYRSGSVRDLNGDGVGGVPALFRVFTQEAGLTYDVSLETSPAKDLQWHIDTKTAAIDRAWDHVVLQSFSTLDSRNPGDPASLIQSARVLAKMFRARNPQADIRLDATWARADLTYQPGGYWYGKPIAAMAADVRAGYDRAAAASPLIHGVVEVGSAWNRAIVTGVAVANPYHGVPFGQVDLWTFDHYHASTFGYYLEALMIFGAITGRDPLSLGPHETAALELGVSPEQATALQQVAHDELVADAQSDAP